jgi:hypothetical protein
LHRIGRFRLLIGSDFESSADSARLQIALQPGPSGHESLTFAGDELTSRPFPNTSI